MKFSFSKALSAVAVAGLLATSASADIIITEIADPDNGGGTPNLRYLEIHNSGATAVDLTGWTIQRWTNATATTTSSIDLSPFGSFAAGGFLVFAANKTDFDAAYSYVADLDAGGGGPADSNGDDQIGIFNASSTLVDIFGVPGEDGTGTAHEFEDGRAERVASSTSASAIWSDADWNVTSDDGPTDSNAALAAPGAYDPGAWIGAVVAGGPEVAVSEAGNIADGSGPISFGSITNNGGTTTFTFTVTNTGDTVLNTSALTVNNTTGAGFSLGSDPLAATVASSGGTDTFTIDLDSSTDGSYVADVSFTNDDADENPFNFTISADVIPSGPVSVANIAEALAAADGTEVIITGTVIATTGENSLNGGRNQFHIQDASGVDGQSAVLIDDSANTLAGSTTAGQTFANLQGTISTFNGTRQFVPTVNVASNGTAALPAPLVVTPAITVFNDIESELIRINNQTFTDGDGTTAFTLNANFNFTTPDTIIVLARIEDQALSFDASVIPNTPVDIIGIAAEFNGTYQIFPRTTADLIAGSTVGNWEVFE